MPPTPAESPAVDEKPDAVWAKTPFTNLIRYVPSGTYFARLRVGGRLIRASLKTKVLSVAKLRLADRERKERGAVEREEEASRGRMSGALAAEILESRIMADASLKPRSRSYYQQRLTALLKSWPALKDLDVRTVIQGDCLGWSSRFAAKTCPSAFNNTVGVLRRLFDIAIEKGVRYENPAVSLKRLPVRPKNLRLPSASQFVDFVDLIKQGGGAVSRQCEELVQFLAFGGFRIGEAKNVTWGDCNFKKGEILVRGDAETGTKNRTVRRAPMIDEIRKLLVGPRERRAGEPPDTAVMEVKECQKAMDRAAKSVGMRRITHHDLRHLLATPCIENGVDIPTVSRWPGHKDGGALAMKTYGHLRAEHSAAMATSSRW